MSASPTITDCAKLPEGLTPLIFWEWLQSCPAYNTRRIWHTKRDDPEEDHWSALEYINGRNPRSFDHAHAGGLAAQLQPETSFKDIIG